MIGGETGCVRTMPDVIGAPFKTEAPTAPRWTVRALVALTCFVVAVLLLWMVPLSKGTQGDLVAGAISFLIQIGVYCALGMPASGEDIHTITTPGEPARPFSEISIWNKAGRLLLALMAVVVCAAPIVWLLSKM